MKRKRMFGGKRCTWSTSFGALFVQVQISLSARQIDSGVCCDIQIPTYLANLTCYNTAYICIFNSPPRASVGVARKQGKTEYSLVEKKKKKKKNMQELELETYMEVK